VVGLLARAGVVRGGAAAGARAPRERAVMTRPIQTLDPPPRAAGAVATEPGGRRAPVLPELWRYRELVRRLVMRDIKVKYQRSVLGLVWTLLNPLITVAILTAVFTYVIRIPTGRYWAFLVSGFFVWNFLQQTLYHSTSILRDHATLNRSVYFPREVLVLSAALSKLVEFLIELGIVLAVLALFHHGGIPASWVALPALVLVQLVFAVGLMLPLAVVSVLFHDVQQAMPIVIMSLFYLAPVFYPVDLIPPAAQPYYRLNPVVGLLELFHRVLYDGVFPDATLLAAVAAAAGALCFIGYRIFRRYREVCVEIA
jgi:ABC-type polysaccharide/polyol phosphate export permease